MKNSLGGWKGDSHTVLGFLKSLDWLVEILCYDGVGQKLSWDQVVFKLQCCNLNQIKPPVKVWTIFELGFWCDIKM